MRKTILSVAAISCGKCCESEGENYFFLPFLPESSSFTNIIKIHVNFSIVSHERPLRGKEIPFLKQSNYIFKLLESGNVKKC